MATRYVAPNGSDSDPGTQTQPFRSFNKAYQASAPGDRALVAIGSYPAQTIDWVAGRDSAAQIIFEPQSGFTITGGLVIYASAVHIKGFASGSIADWKNRTYSITTDSVQVLGASATQYPHNVLVEGVNTKNFDWATSKNLIVRDCDVGPSVVDNNCDRFENRIGGSGAADPTETQNLLIERVAVHDQNRTLVAANNGCHYGGIIFPKGNGITIRECVFERNVVYHLSAGNFSRTDGPRNVLIENCSFGAPVENSYSPNGVNTPNGQHAIQLDAPANPQGNPYSSTWTIRNCKFATGGSMVGCYAPPCGMSGMTLEGNVDSPASADAPPLGATPPPPTGLTLRKVSETATRITLGWDPVPDAVGYRFRTRVSGFNKWSHTWDGKRSTAEFRKADSPFQVQALGVLDEDEYP